MVKRRIREIPPPATNFVEICHNEYHALIQMLRKEISLCLEELWNKEIDEPPFWQQAYHTVYYLDFYLGDNPKKQPDRFGIKENLNEKSEKVLTKQELLDYLADVKAKCDQVLDDMTMKKLEGEDEEEPEEEDEFPDKDEEENETPDEEDEEEEQ